MTTKKPGGTAFSTRRSTEIGHKSQYTPELTHRVSQDSMNVASMPTKSAFKQIKINTEPWQNMPITPILKKEGSFRVKGSIPKLKKKDIKMRLSEAR